MPTIPPTLDVRLGQVQQPARCAEMLRSWAPARNCHSQYPNLARHFVLEFVYSLQITARREIHARLGLALSARQEVYFRPVSVPWGA